MSIIESPRLLLREFALEDIDQLGKVFGDPNVMKYSTNGPLDEKGIRSFINWCRNSYHSNGYGQWAVIERSSGRVIGCCGLSQVEIDGTREIEIGYRLEKAEWGKGFASEIAISTLSYGYEKLNLNKIIAIIANGHTSSIRVAEKIGFSQFNETIFKGWNVRVYYQKRTK